MSLFVIGQRKRTKAGRYRTRYYRTTIEGRAKFGAKAKAAWFDENEVEPVLAQLRQLHPHTQLDALCPLKRPPRVNAAALPVEPAALKQVEAFDALNDK